MSDELVRSFADAIAGSPLEGLGPLTTLRLALEASYDDARRAWPDVALTPARYAEALSRALPDQGELAGSIGGLHTRDLFFAAACAAGDARALAVFDAELLPAGALAASRIDRDATFLAELRDELRVHLLAPQENAAARITHYLGQGPLKSWVQVAAIRLAYTLKRRGAQEERAQAADDALADLVLLDDPERRFAREEVREPLKAAFSEALAALDARTRNVLRLQLVDGLPTEAIGRMYGVHRATVARWISSAHASIVSALRARMREKLGLSPDELDSMLRWMGSQIEITLSAILR